MNALDIIAKFDASGNVLWAKSAGSTSLDCGFAVSSDSFGDIYLTGYSDGPTIVVGSNTLTSPSKTLIFAK